MGELNGQINIVTDGNMEALNVNAWLVVNGTRAKISTDKFRGSQCLEISGNGTSIYPYVYQACLVVGKTYRLTARIKKGSAPSIAIKYVAGSPLYTCYSAEWEYVDVIFTPTDTRLVIQVNQSSSGASENGYIDDIRIEEYKGKIVAKDNILVNGNFEKSPILASGEWLNASTGDTVITSSADNPHRGLCAVRISGSALSNKAIYQSNVLISGQQYRVTGWYRGDGALQSPRLYKGGSFIGIGTVSSEWQRFDEVFTADGVNLGLYGIQGFDGWVEFDDVCLTEYTGKIVGN